MQVILLIIAVSVDVFVACVACGSEQIKIGSAAALCISTVCSGILGISLYAGMALQGVLLKKYALYLSFFGLLAVGIFKLTEYAIRKYIERHKFLCKKVKISFSQLSFILSIYNNPVMADRDHSVVFGGCIFCTCNVIGRDVWRTWCRIWRKVYFSYGAWKFCRQFLCSTLRMQDWHAGI